MTLRMSLGHSGLSIGTQPCCSHATAALLRFDNLASLLVNAISKGRDFGDSIGEISAEPLVRDSGGTQIHFVPILGCILVSIFHIWFVLI